MRQSGSVVKLGKPTGKRFKSPNRGKARNMGAVGRSPQKLRVQRDGIFSVVVAVYKKIT